MQLQNNNNMGRTTAKPVDPAKPAKPVPKPPPPVLVDKKTTETYETGPLLGEGGFAKCYRVKQISTSKSFAAKVIPKQSLKKARAKQKLLTEIKIHSSLKHERIVTFYHAFEDSENVYLLLEVCEKKTFVELLREKKRLTEDELRKYLPQLLGAISYMHSQNVIHRDLKLGNLFMDKDMNIKIGDFGLAALVTEKGERKKTICGTPNYIAPEILFDKANGHSFEVDLWSLGVIMYTLLIGKPPFQTKNINEIYGKIKENKYEFPESVAISNEAKSLISSLLNQKPECRPLVEDIYKHPFMKSPSVIAISSSTSRKSSKATTPSRKPLNEMTNTALLESGKNGCSNRNFDAGKPFSCKGSEVTTPKRLPIEDLLIKTPRREAVIPSRLNVFSTTPSSSQATSKPRLGMIEAMHRNLKIAFENPKQLQKPSSPDVIKPGVFIVKWMDYHNRYGLAYQLTDGSVGVSFNDSSSIILSADNLHFEYLNHKVLGENRKCLYREPYQLNNYPDTLNKKVMLLQKFKKFMSENLDNALTRVDEDPKTTSLDFLVKFMRTSHAIVFRMSNRVLQINFSDHSKLILSEDALVVTHIDQNRKVTPYSLAQVIQGQKQDILVRLNYTKEILEILLSKKASVSTAANNTAAVNTLATNTVNTSPIRAK